MASQAHIKFLLLAIENSIGTAFHQQISLWYGPWRNRKIIRDVILNASEESRPIDKLQMRDPSAEVILSVAEGPEDDIAQTLF
jgi:hypothetical protein